MYSPAEGQGPLSTAAHPIGRIIDGVPPAHSERSTPGAGLCDSCRHQRLVRNTRGSTFSLCQRSRTDSRFPRYPRLPVVRCPGYEARRGED